MIKYLVMAAIIAGMAWVAVDSVDIEGKVNTRAEMLNSL